MALRKTAQTISVVLFEDEGDTERTVDFKARWEICGACEGCATDRGSNVECDGPYGEGGNGFTASEWADQDDDFKRDYLNGVFDQPCSYCKGLGRVQVIDRDLADPADLAILDQQERDLANMRAEERMERRMGA